MCLTMDQCSKKENSVFNLLLLSSPVGEFKVIIQSFIYVFPVCENTIDHVSVG